MRTSARNVLLAGSVLLAGGIACGGGGGNDDGGGGGGPSLTVAKAGAPNGDGQSAVVGTAVTDSLAVIVQEDGLPKAGATVTWSAQGTGALVSPTSVVTDANGRAAARLTLGTVTGAQTVRAAVAGATGSPVLFNLTATVGAATAFTIVGGNNQSVETSVPFDLGLSVKVADQFGNGVAGVTVTWQVQSGSVALNGGATSVTNASGLATNSVTAGATTGAAVVRATNPIVAGNLDFSLTVTQAPVSVDFGNTFFQSARNGTNNPAIDTTQVGRPVRWTGSGGSHTVESTGVTTFTSSGTLSGAGATYTVIFPATGTYTYDCGVHGSLMTGTIVVEP